jgi:hypothetical protein
VLELQILLRQKLNLFAICCQFNFKGLSIQYRIFQFTFCSKQLTLSFCMVFLFFVKTFNPHITSLFFVCYHIIETKNFFIQLFLLQLELPLLALLFNLYCFNIAFEVNNSFIKILHFLLLFLNHFFFKSYYVLKRSISFNFICHFSFKIMASFVHFVQLIYGIIISALECCNLLFLFFRMNSNRA